MTKTALVTGSAGFIGRHMVRELESRGYEVAGVDLQGTPGDLMPHDACDVFRCSEKRFDLVIHAAYHVGGRAGIDGQNMNFAKNVQLDSALFEWAVRTGQKRVLYFSSSAVYPKYLQEPCPQCDDPNCQEGPGPLREEMASPFLTSDWAPLEPGDDYGFAKLVGERLAEDARANGLDVSVVRPFSGYGEDQDPGEYPFPAIVRRARQGDLTVWGPRGQSRDWIHVDDVVNGALAVADSGTVDPVNLCTGVATEMGELATKVFRQAFNHAPDCGPGDFCWEYPTYDESKPTGVFYRVGNPELMLKYYTPKVSLEEGIRRALAA